MAGGGGLARIDVADNDTAHKKQGQNTSQKRGSKRSKKKVETERGGREGGTYTLT
jgi:hypothetical protein